MEEIVAQCLLCSVIVLVVVYYRLRARFSYWNRRNVPNIKPSLEFNELNWMMQKESRFSYYKKVYDRLSPHQYGGFFTFLTPKLLIRDPELIKTVLVEQFDNFSNRTQSSYLENDSLTHNIFNLQDTQWKQTRVCLVQAFNDGNLRGMFELIAASAAELRHSIATARDDGKVADISVLTRLYIVDVVSACVFGLEPKSVATPNSQFIRTANKLRHKNSLKVKIFELLSMIPRNRRHYFGWLFRDEESANFFKQLLSNVIQSRRRNGVTRSDFVQSFIQLMESAESNNDGKQQFKWTLESTEAHCVHFMFAATVAIPTVVSFALYEIAKNSNIQEKLRREIEQHCGQSKGLIQYEAVNQMSYLHNIVLETLRKYPPFAAVQRICTESCFLAGTNVNISRGTRVTISVAGIHHDAKFYPISETFDPERFAEDEKSRHPYCYLPFGKGPRDCIGKKFSLLCIKAAILSVISKFEVSVLPENELSFRFLPRKCTTRVASVKLRFVEK